MALSPKQKEYFSSKSQDQNEMDKKEIKILLEKITKIFQENPDKIKMATEIISQLLEKNSSKKKERPLPFPDAVKAKSKIK